VGIREKEMMRLETGGSSWMPYTKGQRFRVEGKDGFNPGVCTVASVDRSLDYLPEIAEALPIDLLEELGVELVLTMNFLNRAVSMIFIALVCRDGTICDLHKQRLTFAEAA
jgi:hypothetical protein